MQRKNENKQQKYYKEDGKGRKCYSGGTGKPPIFVQAIIDNEKMSAIDFFHITDEYLDWDKSGDDDAVIEPLIDFLSKWGDELIFAFDDMMAELLYSLDTKKIANDIYKNTDYFSGDDFLYTRCTALVNSKRYYNDILKGRRKLKEGILFEPILYVPGLAWARRHGEEADDYPHVTKFCYETMSNEDGWE